MISTLPGLPSDRALRVLVVDNDRDSADSLAMLVKIWGHEVMVVYCGADALTTDIQYLPDVMILDISMPKMDGNELARRIRCVVGREDVLLVALTGHGYEADVRLSKEAGFDHHLLKPVAPSVVAGLLAAASDRRHCAANSPRGSRAGWSVACGACP